MLNEQLAQRYQRIYDQLQGLLGKTEEITAKMATIAAILHNKMPHFLWTGFYILKHDKLIVGPYQGSVACLELTEKKGVCWNGILTKKSVIVPDVRKFPGHIACDQRSTSEIVVPIIKSNGSVYGVLDVDSQNFNAFSDIDKEWLEKIVSLI